MADPSVADDDPVRGVIDKFAASFPLLVTVLTTAGVTTAADLTRIERASQGLTELAFASTGLAVVAAYLAGAEYIRHSPRARKLDTGGPAEAVPAPGPNDDPAAIAEQVSRLEVASKNAELSASKLAAAVAKVEKLAKALAEALAKAPADQPCAEKQKRRQCEGPGRTKCVVRFLLGAPGRTRQRRFVSFSALFLAVGLVAGAFAAVKPVSDPPRTDLAVVRTPRPHAHIHVDAHGLGTGKVVTVRAAIAIRPHDTPQLDYRILGASADGKVDVTFDVDLFGLSGRLVVTSCVHPEKSPQRGTSEGCGHIDLLISAPPRLKGKGGR